MASSLSFRLWSFSWPAFLNTRTSFCSKSYKTPGTLSSISTNGKSFGLSSKLPFQLLFSSLSLVLSEDWLNDELGGFPFRRILLLSSDLEPPSKDLDAPLAFFKIELEETEDLIWKDDVLLVRNPLELGLDMLSVPPRDCRREGPLLTHFPSEVPRLILLEVSLKLSCSTLSLNWYFSWKL